VNASSERDIETAFATLVQQHVDTLLIDADALFVSRRDQIGRTGGTSLDSGDLRFARVRRGRRPDELRNQPDRRID
jgi:hypothetical protein